MGLLPTTPSISLLNSVFLSVSGAMTPAGLHQSCIIPLIKSGAVSCLTTTGANVYHDLHRTLGYVIHEVNPQGAYARSKEAGERAVRASHGKHLILRTAWVYGPFGTNFVKTMLRLGAERDEIRVVDDQTGRPTSTGDLAEAILAIAEAAQDPDFAQWGTYHYAGADTVTWHGFATMIFAEAETFGRKVPRVQPIATAEFPTAAPRPAYSVLSTAKLERSFGIKPRPLRASLKATIERLLGRRDKA